MISKELFIKELKDTSIPADQTLEKLKQILNQSGDLFSPFNKDRINEFLPNHHWDADYFYKQQYWLDNHFSYELCEHLLAVKKQLQDEGYEKDFRITSRTPTYNKDDTIMKLDNFTPPKNVAEQLASGDTRNIQASLLSLLNDNAINTEIAIKTVYYVWDKKSDIFEETRVSAYIDPIQQDKSLWDKNYFFEQQAHLMSNFSLERILHLLNVKEFLKNKGDPTFNVTPTASKTTTETKAMLKTSSSIQFDKEAEHNPFFKNLLIIGGAVLAAAIAIFLIIK